MSDVTREEALAELARGLCEIKYAKTDGTIRTAIGTRNVELIKENCNIESKNSGRAESDQAVVYFDMDRSGWRSFSIGRLIRVSCFAETE